MFVTASLINSMLRKWRESFDEKLKQLRLLQDRMAAATSYAEWREFAQQVRVAGNNSGPGCKQMDAVTRADSNDGRSFVFKMAGSCFGSSRSSCPSTNSGLDVVA